MTLYILRHASAGSRRRNPLLDRKRGLDKEGKQQCLLIGAYLNAMGVSFDAIISSPLKRSLQTASLVATDWPSVYPKAPTDLVPSGYAISGVFDLAPLTGVSVSDAPPPTSSRFRASTVKNPIDRLSGDQNG